MLRRMDGSEFEMPQGAAERLSEIAETTEHADLVRMLAGAMQDLLADGAPIEELVFTCAELRQLFGIAPDELRRAFH